MWLRENKKSNIVVNDPKGELAKKFFVPATYRGYEVVQFNLINPLNTNIYNPLAFAYEAAREGDFIKTASYVENISKVFFPSNGGDDKFWQDAAGNSFKRIAFGLIDYYLEEEKDYRAYADKVGLDAKTVATHIDNMWGKVSLYNCYTMSVNLAAKRKQSPNTELAKKQKAGEFDGIDPQLFETMKQEAATQSSAEPWEDKPDMDMLSLFFALTDMLPRNQMRTLVSNVNNSLKAMGGSEKTMASVMGIALTAMV